MVQEWKIWSLANDAYSEDHLPRQNGWNRWNPFAFLRAHSIKIGFWDAKRAPLLSRPSSCCEQLDICLFQDGNRSSCTWWKIILTRLTLDFFFLLLLSQIPVGIWLISCSSLSDHTQPCLKGLCPKNWRERWRGRTKAAAFWGCQRNFKKAGNLGGKVERCTLKSRRAPWNKQAAPGAKVSPNQVNMTSLFWKLLKTTSLELFLPTNRSVADQKASLRLFNNSSFFLIEIASYSQTGRRKNKSIIFLMSFVLLRHLSRAIGFWVLWGMRHLSSMNRDDPKDLFLYIMLFEKMMDGRPSKKKSGDMRPQKMPISVGEEAPMCTWQKNPVLGSIRQRAWKTFSRGGGEEGQNTLS